MTLKVETAKTSDQNAELIAIAKEQRLAGTPLSFGEFIGMYDTTSRTVSDEKEIAFIFDKDPKEIKQAITTFAKNNEIRNALGVVPKDEYEFVEIQLAKWKTTMTYQGVFTMDTPYKVDDKVVDEESMAMLTTQELAELVLSDPKVIPFKKMFPRLIYENRKLNLSFSERQIELGLERWMDSAKTNIRKNELGRLVYESPVLEELTEPEWTKFVDAITTVNKEETRTVLKHFIWQAKRKMFGYPVTDHMMVVLFGAQGAGKSTVVKHLTSVIRDFTASTNFEAITDDRTHDLWDNYVLVFDEMGRSTTSNLEDIKRKITEDTWTSRVLKTNTETVINNLATFIGTTNKDMSRLIFDDTGMRRFYQIDCRGLIDWAVTSNVNYLRLWKSVDENADSPLTRDQEILKKIKRVQASKRQIPMMEKWLRERDHRPFVEETVKASALFEEFVNYEKANNGTGRSDINSSKFGRDIKDIALNIPGLSVVKKKTNAGNVYQIIYEGDVNREDFE